MIRFLLLGLLAYILVKFVRAILLPPSKDRVRVRMGGPGERDDVIEICADCGRERGAKHSC